MAVRLAVDLGLHLDPEPYVLAGLIDAEEAMIRRVVWGGVFVHDRYSPLCRMSGQRWLTSLQNVESVCRSASWHR